MLGNASSRGIRFVVPSAIALAAILAGCSDGHQRQTRSASTPTAASSVERPLAESTSTSRPPSAGDRNESGAIDFPGREATFQFRQQLEATYRDSLQRPTTLSFVDIEGTIVWTQEYLRYRVNGCGHADAISRVRAQIEGRGIQPICTDFTGATVVFPPRNEPFAFRQELEQIYRDLLRRGAVETFVDPEGDIVWTQEYLRYRVNGCDHTQALERVLSQVGGGPVQPTCSGPVTPIPPTPPTATTVTDCVSSVTSGSIPATLIRGPRPNAGAGPILTASSNTGSQITLTASQPVDTIVVSCNTTTTGLAVGLRPLVVLDSYFELRLPSPQQTIALTIEGRSLPFRLEFAASAGNGAFGSYLSQPFLGAPSTATLTTTVSPNPVAVTPGPITDLAPCLGFTNAWVYRVTITETSGVPVTLTRDVIIVNGSISMESTINSGISARGSITRLSCRTIPGSTTIQHQYSGTDANGHAISITTPVIVLIPR